MIKPQCATFRKETKSLREQWAWYLTNGMRCVNARGEVCPHPYALALIRKIISNESGEYADEE